MRLNHHHRRDRAFSLVELLISMVILVVIMAMISTMLSDVQLGWTKVRSRAMEFRDARNAFETIANRLSQARIDTYYDYEMEQGIPTSYHKSSHLHFVAGRSVDWVPTTIAKGIGHSVFFEAPFGMSRQQDLKGLTSLINGWGYFCGFGNNAAWQPKFTRSIIPGQHRFRLFEFHLPTENLLLHSQSGNGTTGYDWITDHFETGTVSMLADNVIVFLILPMHSNETGKTHELATEYRFDSRAFELSPSEANAERSRHEVPPLIRMTMVVVSEADYLRFNPEDTDKIPKVFETSELAPFQKSKNYEEDLAALEAHLIENRIDYRVFTTVISIRSAKWTNRNVDQVNP